MSDFHIPFSNDSLTRMEERAHLRKLNSLTFKKIEERHDIARDIMNREGLETIALDIRYDDDLNVEEYHWINMDCPKMKKAYKRLKKLRKKIRKSDDLKEHIGFGNTTHPLDLKYEEICRDSGDYEKFWEWSILQINKNVRD